MSKLTTLFLITLVLFFSLSNAARPEPVHPNDSSSLTKTHQSDAEADAGDLNEDCGGVGEEECLMRRALADAHLDYIYTQKTKP